jgi:hypothetical protein
MTKRTGIIDGKFLLQAETCGNHDLKIKKYNCPNIKDVPLMKSKTIIKQYNYLELYLHL